MAEVAEARLHTRASRALLAKLQTMTQKALAKLLGVKRARLGHWANGRHRPDADGRIACMTHLSPEGAQ